jgi:hypothetical protein
LNVHFSFFIAMQQVDKQTPVSKQRLGKHVPAEMTSVHR